MTTPERPERDTLRLLRETIDDIATNPAVAGDGPIFSIRMRFLPDQAWSAVEPNRRDLRDLIQLLRHLDMPSSDIRLRRVYTMLALAAKPEWQEGIIDARSAYEAAQLPGDNLIQDPDDPPVTRGEQRVPKWIRPREAFALWAYGEVIHHEYRKELRWISLGPGNRQGAVRMMAQLYAYALLEQAGFISGLLRDGLREPLD